MNASTWQLRGAFPRFALLRRVTPALLAALLAATLGVSSGCGPDRKDGRYGDRTWREPKRPDRKDGKRPLRDLVGQFALLPHTRIGADEPFWSIAPLTVIETQSVIRLLNRVTEGTSVCEVHIVMGPNPGSNRPAQAWFGQPSSLPPLIVGDGWYVFKFDNTTGRPWRLAASRRVVAAGCGTTVLFQVAEDFHRVALLEGVNCTIELTSEIVPAGQPGHSQRLSGVNDFSEADWNGVLSAPAATSTNAQFDAFIAGTVKPEMLRLGL